jgi:hypothetical protein
MLYNGNDIQMKHCVNHLIETNVFYDHVVQRYANHDMTLDENDKEFAQQINSKFQIDIEPYIQILCKQSDEHLKQFYAFFNYYLYDGSDSVPTISHYSQIEDLGTLICFIYFIQYIFL